MNATDTVLESVHDWLPQIWKAGLQRLSELEKSSVCLNECESVLCHLDDGGPFDEEIKFEDDAGNVVHSGADYHRLISWVMKELLLAAWTAEDDELKSLVERVLVSGDWLEDDSLLEELFRDYTPDTIPLAQKEILSSMKRLYQAEAVERFKDHPSKYSYTPRHRFLCTPELEAALLHAARSIYLDHQKGTNIEWHDSFVVLSSSKDPEDIEHLLASMPTVADQISTDEPRLEAVKSFLHSESHRDRGVFYLTEALETIVNEFMGDMYSAFPGLDAACAALKTEFDSGELVWYRDRPLDRSTVNMKSENQDRFVSLALDGVEEVPAPLSKPPWLGFREQLTIAGRLEKWVETLKDAGLPELQTSAIQETTLGTISGHPLFKGCGDFAEILRQRCQSHRTQTENSIRVAYKLFVSAKPPPKFLPWNLRPLPPRASRREPTALEGEKKRTQPSGGKPDKGRTSKKQKR